MLEAMKGVKKACMDSPPGFGVKPVTYLRSGELEDPIDQNFSFDTPDTWSYLEKVNDLLTSPPAFEVRLFYWHEGEGDMEKKIPSTSPFYHCSPQSPHTQSCYAPHILPAGSPVHYSVLSP